MTLRTALCRGAALGALLACVVAPAAANAATKHHPKPRHVAPPSATKSEVDELRAEVQSLEAWKSQQEASAQQTQSQVNQLQGQLTEANDRAARAEQQVAEQIQTIPGTVSAEVAKHAPKTDKIYYKGITLTLGGFAAAEAVYRTKNNVADIGSNYSKIPYDNNRSPTPTSCAARRARAGSRSWRKATSTRTWSPRSTASSTSWPARRPPTRTRATHSARGSATSTARSTGTTRAGTCWPVRTGRWRR